MGDNRGIFVLVVVICIVFFVGVLLIFLCGFFIAPLKDGTGDQDIIVHSMLWVGSGLVLLKEVPVEVVLVLALL